MKGVTLTGTGERITVIDALRGFFTYRHLFDSCDAAFWCDGDDAARNVFPRRRFVLNEIFSWLIRYLVFGKFFIIFSWLFGLSFFIQMGPGQRKEGLISVPVFCGVWCCC